ncbi:MAG: hypothetical protein C4547_13650 [Phycisphaerales bacterium]|nr:MAG: hypothetical protein C4547_13650 [Phycisphaerales bacterium]
MFKSLQLTGIVPLLIVGPLPARPAECAHTEYGWTAASGADEDDSANGVVSATDGSLLVTGVMRGTVDFDPGTKKDKHRSKGLGDIFVSRFDPYSEYSYTIRIGGKLLDGGLGISVASNGDSLLCGSFQGKVDFDPGKAKDKHKASGHDAFVTSYGAGGDYRWTRTFAGNGPEDVAKDIVIDPEGNIIVVGDFTGTADFDPGSGKDRRTSFGRNDVFVVQLDGRGRYLWSSTFGGPLDDHAFGAAVDGNGNVVVTGYFRGSVDFDPGPGVDMHHSAGNEDAFITKLGPDGAYHWTHTFGGVGFNDQGRDVMTDEAGNIYATGSFVDTVDFDRRGDGDIRIAKGFSDIFVTSRAGDGSYRWTAHMGGTNIEAGFSIALDRNLVQLVVVGPFSGTVDFDPGEGLDERTAISGPRDIFATWLTLDAAYVRTDTIGGTGNDVPWSVAVAPDSSVVVAGKFDSSDADFDPTSGVDVHATNGRDDMFIAKLYCGPCEAVERHSLTVKEKNRTLLGEVRALVPGGRVTVECTPTDPPGEPIQTRVDIDGENMGKYKLKNLKKGEYACAITEVRDADGKSVCDQPAGKRTVTVK